MHLSLPELNLRYSSLATMIKVRLLSQIMKTRILGMLWLEFLQMEWGQYLVKYIPGRYLTVTSHKNLM